MTVGTEGGAEEEEGEGGEIYELRHLDVIFPYKTNKLDGSFIYHKRLINVSVLISS